MGIRMFIHLSCPKEAQVKYKLTHSCILWETCFIQLFESLRTMAQEHGSQNTATDCFLAYWLQDFLLYWELSLKGLSPIKPKPKGCSVAFTASKQSIPVLEWEIVEENLPLWLSILKWEQQRWSNLELYLCPQLEDSWRGDRGLSVDWLT